MELVNELYKYKERAEINEGLTASAIKTLILILAPFTPHICEEMWQHLGNPESLYHEQWPKYDESALVRDVVEVVVQINGKVKDRLSVASGMGKEELEKYCLQSEKINALVADKQIVKVITVPDKLLNIVIK